MKNWLSWFNIYLCFCLTLLATGCATEDNPKKQESTIRFHLEANQDGTGRSGPVAVTHQKFIVNVDKEPFVTEGDVEKAAVVDTMGGFSIQIALDAHAALHLDMITSSYKGKRIAIMTQFPKKHAKTYWVAAPLITRRISNGIFVFTPDLTREEAERMVRGLNNVAVKAKKKKESF